ncbi:unnamed protein product, partial [Amoebophrya sp. A25]|eukprot:GSA25T00009238001.1
MLGASLIPADRLHIRFEKDDGMQRPEMMEVLRKATKWTLKTYYSCSSQTFALELPGSCNDMQRRGVINSVEQVQGAGVYTLLVLELEADTQMQKPSYADEWFRGF